MGTNRQPFILQQLSLTASTAYAVCVPNESTLGQNIAANYWARKFAAEEQHPLFVTTWIAGYHFQWAVQRAALTYAQTRNSAEFSSIVTGAIQQLQNQLGEDTGEARTRFNKQHALQPCDERQIWQIEALVLRCRHFTNDSWRIGSAFQNDGTWRQLMIWTVLGLDESLSQLAFDGVAQVTATQLSARSGISELLCSWYLDTHLSQEERAQAIQDALIELTTTWGYRDVTALIRQAHAADAAEYPGTDREDYLCVLQTPQGGPVYCRSSSRLSEELQKARDRNTPYACCPAPDPSVHPRSNFDLEEKENTHE